MPKEKEKPRIRLGIYLSYVKNELDNENKCLELPFTIMLLISFSYLALLHLSQDRVYIAEDALRMDIEENANFAWSHQFGHKTVYDVNSLADFWSWMQLGYIPLVVQPTWAYSEDIQFDYDSVVEGTNYSAFNTAQLPLQWQLEGFGSTAKAVPVREDLLHYNRIIGGIRMRQERAEAGYDQCRFPGNIPEDVWKTWLSKPCSPASPSYELPPEPWAAESFTTAERVEWLFTSILNPDQIRQKLYDMEDGCDGLSARLEDDARTYMHCLCEQCMGEDGVSRPWLDEETQRIEVGFITFNPEYNLLSLVTCNFFFNRGGRIHKFVHVQSSFARHFAGDIFEIAGMVFCDVVFLASLCWVFASESMEIVRAIRGSQRRWYMTLYEDYIGFWNAIDWISIFTSILICFLFGQLIISTADVTDAFQRFAAFYANPENFTSVEDLENEMQHFFEMVEDMCFIERWYRQSFCIYPMTVMLRLFKSFAAQPRLSVVTRTLSSSATDLLHFFIIFFSVFFCMAVNSVLLFGQDITDFATLTRAVFTNFRGMCGDWDWTAMKSTDRYMAGVWFWLFVNIEMILLLNMLLAILMDAYSEVNAQVDDAMTLPQQISEMVRRRRQFLSGKRVRLTDVWNAYFKVYEDEKQMLNSDVLICSDDIEKTVPGIPAEQAARTLKNAKAIHDAANEQPFGTEEMKDLLEKLEDRSRTMRDMVQDIKDWVVMYEEPSARTNQSFLPNAESRQVDVDGLIVETVKEVIGGVGDELDVSIRHMIKPLHQRQAEIEAQQQDINISVKDTFRVFQQIRSQTDNMVETVRKLAYDKQRRIPYQATESKARGGRMLNVCSATGWSTQ